MKPLIKEDTTLWLDAEFERLDAYLRLVVLEQWLGRGGSSAPLSSAGEINVFQLLNLDPADNDPLTRLNGELSRLEAMRTPKASPYAPTASPAPIPAHLMATFDFGRPEWDILLAVAAPALDHRYRIIYGWLQGSPGRCHADQGLLLRILARTRLQRIAVARFLSAHPLVCRFHLIGTGAGELNEPAMFHPSNRLLALFCGQTSLDPELFDCLFPLQQPQTSPELRPLQLEPVIQNLVRELRYRDNNLSFRLLLQGERGAGRREAAATIGAALGLQVLELDLETLIRRDGGFYANLDRIVREMLLTGAVPLIAHMENLAPPEPPYPAWRAHLLRTLNNTFRLVFLLEDEHNRVALDEATESTVHVSVVPLRFPFPDLATRTRAWESALKTNGLVTNHLTSEQLAAMFRFNRGRINEAAKTGRMLRIGDLSRSTDELLLDACRGICNYQLSRLAERVPCPFTWSDLVLPNATRGHLQDLAAYFQQREALFDRWGFANRVSQKGLHALFYGPPGTGKTMAASVIAAALNLELYRIDLSSIISKYIGETEKNLSAIFQEARQANAILFFDEADALFGKRSEVKDAHDRFANIETSYLLQQMESYDGVTILATNLLQNLDDAFTRRIKFIVELPFPDAAERLRLWKGMFPKQVPLARDIDFDFLSERFPLSGGEIKNIVLGAAAFAMEASTSVTMAQLIFALRREQEKKGQLFVNEDFQPYTEAATTHPIQREPT